MYLLVVFLSCRVGNHVGNQRYGDWNNFTKFQPIQSNSTFPLLLPDHRLQQPTNGT